MSEAADDLIRRLAADAAPVRRLAPPWRRLLWWALLCAPYVAVTVWIMPQLPDLPAKLGQMQFAMQQGAALLTAIAAAYAAFVAVVPGRARWPLLLPLLPLAVWLASLGKGCMDEWRLGLTTWYLDLECLPKIIYIGLLPAVVMVIMLQRGAPLLPRISMLLGGLAAAALGNFGLRLFHPHDASLMVLVWQVGSVALLTVIAGWAGPRLLSWQAKGVSP